MNDIKIFDWSAIYQSLDKKGYALLPSLLTSDECHQLTSLYSKTDIYRSTINMQRYRFGKGEYKYFSYPLPQIIQQIRSNFYAPLATLANDWMQRLSIKETFPTSHEELLNSCREQGQLRPTPLILRYEVEGFNTLHQDLYGDVYFPFQVVFALSEPGKDFEGGESIFVEQLPRAQSRAEVVRPRLGDALIFTTNFRPVTGTRGYYRAKMKHGISPVTSGIRYALGVIFHDAK